ncbi:MAG: transposase family protein [Candidatus Binatia bacterium]
MRAPAGRPPPLGEGAVIQAVGGCRLLRGKEKRITTLLNKVIGLQGVWVRGVEPPAGKPRLVIEVVRRARRPRCGGCDQRRRRVKDRRCRSWRHLDLFGMRTYLRYRIRRVNGRCCGMKTEQVS